MNLMEKIEKDYLRTDLPEFRVGDTVRVHVKIVEGEKERIQMIEGLVIRKRGDGTRATFTVRKVSFNIGVERLFPLHAPTIDKIDVVRRNRVRRARLYYLRDLRGKAARLTEVKGAFAKKKAKVSVPESAE
ncbi:MAG: 50S ribosomal protein L19 [Candidatus Nitrosotenuis sp.]|nr:MAG: 50S ribosomal protein L19 [Candidatus Nitrosotenuis sp.]